MQLRDSLLSLKNLYTASLNLLVPQTLEETYKVIGKEAIKIVDGDESRIILKNGHTFRTVYDSSKVLKVVKLRKDGFTKQAYTKNEAFVVNYTAIHEAHPEVAKKGIKSAVFIPLGVKNRVSGVLIVRSTKKTTFSDEDLEMLKLFGSIANMAIQKNDSLEKAKDALHKRDVFIGMAAHELRSPLTPLWIYTQLFDKKIQEGEMPSRSLSQKLIQEVTRITKLVNELLQVKQINKGHLEYFFENCNIQDIVKTALTNFQFTHPGRIINYQSNIENIPVFIYGDFDKLLQVTTNILNNAAKYSRKETTIVVRLEKNTTHINLDVSDRGMGIDKKDLPHIFGEFYRGENSQADGMGLGLFLTKKIITKHKGEIIITSEKSIGTNVRVSLPITD